MKFERIALFILLFSLQHLETQENAEVKRVYLFRMISFYVKYEVYCTKEVSGYFKYPETVAGSEYYFTYEGVTFYRQSLFDPDCYIYTLPTPSLLYSNSRGELLLLRKRFAPVTDNDKKALNFPYGYARN